MADKLRIKLVRSCGPAVKKDQTATCRAMGLRKIGDTYYFIYSSEHQHELCYATSKSPDRDFTFGGVIVSNGDIGINGRKKEDRLMMTGNNHGSIVRVDGRYYIFGHRHTNASMFSRQGVAEEIFMDAEGHFAQAEMTSCGLYGGPLLGVGSYPAAIACHLQSKNGACFSFFASQNFLHPRLTQEGPDRESDPGQFIANLRDGATAGFKYFDFESDQPQSIAVQIRGRAKGVLYVYTGEPGGFPAAQIPVGVKAKDWVTAASALKAGGSRTPLYFLFRGRGRLDFSSFDLQP